MAIFSGFILDCPGDNHVQYTCEGGSTEAWWIGPDDVAPGGLDTLAATGDLVLANDRIVAVIEALDQSCTRQDAKILVTMGD